MGWVLHHAAVTRSTNLDARSGRPCDVFTADFQTQGRGRLDHVWSSAPCENLMMSAVIGVEGLSAEAVATLPLVVGLAVARALAPFLPAAKAPRLKWPNDVWVDGRKICGILCERNGDAVIAGLGVNVRQTSFAPALADRATSLALVCGAAACPAVADVRDAVLRELDAVLVPWRANGFASLLPAYERLDLLRGCHVSVLQTDGDATPICGLCGGVRPDGALDVAGRSVYAGEAHVETIETAKGKRP